MQLSKVERLLLANQYRILSMLEQESAEYYDRLCEALERGFESVYEDRIFRDIHDGLPVEECRFVAQAMALYWVIQRSYENLRDKAGIEEQHIVFLGFDGNHETQYMAYARYFFEKEGRFPHLKLGSDTFNSHMPMVDRYRRQLEVWESMEQKPDLMPEDITTILEVRGGTAR